MSDTPDDTTTIDTITAKLSELSPAQVEYVSRMVDQIQAEPAVEAPREELIAAQYASLPPREQARIARHMALAASRVKKPRA